MSKYFSDCQKMQRNATLLTVMCILVCLTFNYTFPLHRETTKWSLIGVFANHSPTCNKATPHHDFVDRTKKMTIDIENSSRKIKDTSQDKGIKYSKDKNTLNEDDLRQYEQLVIMKKYPYLDLKELDLKYSPSSKHIRQNIKFHSEPNLGNDPSICEPFEDDINVEIMNRGLSGFAIPVTLKSQKNVDELNKNTIKKSPEHSMLENLQVAIVQFEERKKI